MSEQKNLQEQLGSAIEEFKHARDKFNDEAEKFGEAKAETKQEIENLNNEINELKSQLDDLETKANRPDFETGEGQKSDNMTPEQKKAFFKFMREGKAGMFPEERKALVQDETGEIIVPEALDQQIQRELPKLTIARDLAQVRTIGTNRQRRRSMNEVQVVWGNLETGVGKAWADGESDLVPEEEYLYVEDIFGWTTIGEDELEDADVNLQQYMASSYARAFAEAEDTAMFTGTGHANGQPEGILTNSEISSLSAGTAGEIATDDFIKLEYQVPAQYRQNGVYVVNSKTELALRLKKDNDGQYLWQPSIQAGRPNSFNGKAMYNQDDIPEVAGGADVAVFGDFNAGYRILNRNGGTLKRLEEKFIDQGLIGFRYKRRVGGGVIRPRALAKLSVPASSA